MTEKLNEKLQEILTKLQKLDAIQKSVEILQETLTVMDSKIQSLASAQASAYRDMNDLKESESFYEYKQQISLKISELERKGNILENKITELENKSLYLEAYSRRGNIKFKNSKRVPNGCFATFSNQSSGTEIVVEPEN